ncbi:hypothetical protein [Photorhabdus heterorhabditis]|uniref:Uncharacterized protein n=1 Tax=Photorhabdus heterorhabditis TaxID=880156 RepID=A0A5B0VJG4_9GAMM|nr:hypothetical protein [Photorhabdus heterorhabditis]KAA1174614.1 hypothetical protein F0L16_20850 [Photorhabdus heterorhabditis]
MNNKNVTKGFFKNMFYSLFKDFFWSNILAFAVFLWGIISVCFFSNSWGIAFCIGNFIIIVLYFYFIYLSEKKKG